MFGWGYSKYYRSEGFDILGSSHEGVACSDFYENKTVEIGAFENCNKTIT
jgi:hypothetical protein